MRKLVMTGFLVLLLFAGTSDARAGEVVLVDDGKAVCTIVTGNDDRMSLVLSTLFRSTTQTKPSNVLAEAADDLAEHLNKIGKIPFHTQVHRAGMVPVVTDPKEAKTPYRILLGTAAIETYHMQGEADQLSYMGYIYRTVGNDLLIFGASSKGTANGIYGFLQDELGVRWFGPNELFTVIPEMENWIADREKSKTVRISVGPLDKKVEPSFYGRNGGPDRPETHFSVHRWGRRMRQLDGRQAFDQASHHLYRMFPVDRYAKEHPDYYAMTDGARRIYDKWNFALCWSNPEVVDLASQQAVTCFKGSRFNDSFSLGINDGGAYCGCPECAKLQPPRYFRNGRVASDMYYHFVNEVAQRTAREFPGRFIGAIAYNDVTAPPLGKIEDNVFVVLANDISQYFDADYRNTDAALVKAWAEKGIKLGMYYYLEQAGVTPSYFARHLAAELKDKHHRGFRVLFNEGSVGAVVSPLGYVNYRLWWDVNLDPEVLLDEYFTALYGPAAKPMKALYELFEEIHLRPRKGGFLYEYNKFPQFRPYTGDDLKKIRGLLAAAHASILQMGSGDGGWERPEERRLAYTSNSMKVFLNMLEGIVLARELEQAEGNLDDIEIVKRLETIERLNTILNGNDRLYRETLILDATSSSLHRWAAQTTAIRHTWKTYLSEVIGTALVKLYLGVRPAEARVDARAKRRLDAAVSVYTTGDLQSALFSYRAGELQPGANLVVNPGFEAMETKPSNPSSELLAKLDWGNSKVYGWAIYPPPGNRACGAFDVSTKERRSGKQSGVFRGTGDGLYLTVVEGLKAGQIYHVEAYLKNTAHVTRVDVPVASLSIHWLNKDDNWTAQSLNSSVESRELDRWIRLEQVVRIPEKAAKAVVLIQVSPLHGEEEAFVDDVAFRLLR